MVATGCSILQPEEQGLNPGEEIAVTTSQTPEYQPKDTPNQEVTSNLRAPVSDKGLGVEWRLQGVYADSYQGSVLTILVKNTNELPLPVDAIGDPVVEVADGNGGWTAVPLLGYDPAVNTDVMPPGLDEPLGSGASTNLQYRIGAAPGGLWNARLSIGNVTWIGDLNL
ncbi:hypothetical protein G7Y31_08710 [Corynebacterium lizhenjunii]|uniref:DUF4352 domain-containing protein n=1 Tax=Corynebacterium lizhenjunii TaxID=2709394 RepID=A0A7T0KGK6_9CORY|nr:hypothetical protein G7Y31_08710 [Corynebacterium lizhenjunii]